MANSAVGFFFSRIQTRDQALTAVKNASIVFFLTAFYQLALSYWVGVNVLWDAATYYICGYFLLKKNSRGAAVVLFLIAAFSVYVTLENSPGYAIGGVNFPISILIFVAASRSLVATFRLPKFAAPVSVEVSAPASAAP